MHVDFSNMQAVASEYWNIPRFPAVLPALGLDSLINASSWVAAGIDVRDSRSAFNALSIV